MVSKWSSKNGKSFFQKWPLRCQRTSGQIMFNNPWRGFFIVRMLESRFTHNDWLAFLRELKIKLVCLQKESYASSEMYRSIRLLWWWRNIYIGIYCVFLALVITQGVLCVGDMRCSCTYCVCRTSTSLFNSSTCATTDHCQSAKDTDTWVQIPFRGWHSNPPLLDR